MVQYLHLLDPEIPDVWPEDIYISNAGVHGPNPDRFLAAVKYIMEHQPRLAPGPSDSYNV